MCSTIKVNITKAFGNGFVRGAIKSIDIGNIHNPRSKKTLTKGENITNSWIHVGDSIKKSLTKVENGSR